MVAGMKILSDSETKDSRCVNSRIFLAMCNKIIERFLSYSEEEEGEKYTKKNLHYIRHLKQKQDPLSHFLCSANERKEDSLHLTPDEHEFYGKKRKINNQISINVCSLYFCWSLNNLFVCIS